MIKLTYTFFCAVLLLFILPTQMYAQPAGTRGLYFDGVDDIVNVPYIASTSFAGADDYTVEMWVKLPELNAFYNLAVKNAGGGGLLTTVFTITNTGVITFATDKAGTGWEYGNTVSGLIPINKWIHLAFVSNAGTKEIYVDGVSQSLTVTGNTGSQLTAGASAQPWNFGISGGFGGGFFKGQLDEIRIFNTARNSGQIASDMASINPDGAVMFLRMNDSSGQTVTDTGIGTNNGTLGANSSAGADDPLWVIRTTNNSDSGAGSFRQAITDANAYSDTNYLDFSINETATTETIVLASALPTISNPVIIDGYSAHGSSKNTNSFGAANNAAIKIEINGVGVPADGAPYENAITLSASNSTIKGLAVGGVPNDLGSQFGIRITGSNNSIEGCYIGLQANGTFWANMDGVDLGGSNNVVGWLSTLDVAKFNVISGNNIQGIVLRGTNNTAQGNYVGTNLAGTSAIGNGERGVVATDNASGAQILNNVISGNGSQGGIRIQYGSSGTIVKGNRIGTQANGTGSIPNTNEGIVIDDNGGSPAINSIIGGTGAGEANIIANSGGYGILIQNVGTTGHLISGNQIYSNTSSGIYLFNGGNNLKVSPIILTASTTTITGTCALGDVVEVFENNNGETQGRTYKGQATVTGTNWTFTGVFTINNFVTATARDGSNNTSTFSTPLTVSPTYYSRDNGNWNVSGTWSTVALGGVTCGCAPVSQGSDVIIGHNVNVPNATDINNHNITVKAAGTLNLAVGNTNNINTLITEAGSTINVNSGDFNLAYPATTTINGILNRYNIGVFPDNMTFANGSTYNHGIDGGTIPTATWGATSTIEVTGINSTAPLGLNQTFGNFTWNTNTIQSAPVTLNGIITIAGNLILSSTNGQSLGFGTSTINIKGNMVHNITTSFVPNSSTFVFNSSTQAQTISGASGPTFYNLVIDNTAPTPTVTCVSDGFYTINNALTLTNGLLVLGMTAGYSLDYLGTSANFMRTNGWIQTNAADVYTEFTGAFTYPVGNATAYQPITIANINNPCYVRFDASTLSIPTSIGSWYIDNGVTASDVTLVNPQGVTSGSVAYKYNAGSWNALTTTPSGSNYVVTSALLGGGVLYEISIFAPTVTATTATNVTTNSFSANWSTVVGATDYRIDVSTDNFSTFILQDQLTGNVANYNVTGLSANTVYYYRVQSFNGSWSGESNTKITSTSLPAGSGNTVGFDGVDDRLQFSALAPTNTITFELWYKPQNNAQSTIFHNTGDGSVNPSTGLWLERDPTFLRVSLGRDGDRSMQDFSYTTDINKWYHIAVTYNHPNVTIYVNGVSLGIQTFTSPGFGNATFNSTQPLIFGDFLGGYLTNGQIDEIKIWNTARTIDQIRASMCSKLVGTESGLVGYFRLDENTGTTIENKAYGSTVDGTLVNAPTWETSGAPIGDISVYQNDPSSITLTDTDAMTANGFTGLPDWVYLYKVNTPVVGTTKPANYASLYNDRYWGMFFVGGTNPQATLTYNYSANPTVDVANALRFAQRDNNADLTWASMGGVQNRLARKLTHTETNAGEFILAERNAVITNYKDGGTILTFSSASSSYTQLPRYVQSDFTIEFWMRTSQTGIGTAGQWETGTGLVTANTGGTDDFGITLIADKVTAGTANTTLTSTSVINNGKWNHIAISRTKSTGSLILYVDGKPEASMTGVNTGIDLLGASSINIGRLLTGTNYFDGSIDELRIWNVALPELTIKDWVNLRANDQHPNFANLEAYYRFDEGIGSGTLTEDLVNGNDANLLGGTVFADANQPLGDGAVTRLIVPATSNTVSIFPQAGVTMNFGAVTPNGEVVVTRIDGEPESFPTDIPNMRFMNCYWVVRNYGTNQTFSPLPEIKFEVPAGNVISPTDLASPNNIKLYKRPDDAVGSGTWIGVARATGFGSIRFAEAFAGGSPTPVSDFSQFVIGSPSSSLPITLTQFRGERINGGTGETTEEVLLEWQTAQEINNKGFEVEMSFDGLTYQKIAFVEGAGSSNVPKHYTLNTINQNEAYYRLKQIDFGGSFSYSPVVFVEGMAGKDFVRVYPNPTQNEFKIKVSDNILPTEEVKMDIYDMAGKRVWRGAGKLADIQNKVNLTFNSWKQGNYLLYLRTNKKKLMTKFIKQ